MRHLSRHAWHAAGWIFVALGVIGAFLPIMPTVVFLLAAAWCFSKSHPHLADKLYAHPRYGPPLRDWRDRRAISRKGKISALIAMTLSIPFTALVLGPLFAMIPVVVLLTVGPWIWTRAE